MNADYGKIGELRVALESIATQLGFRLTSFEIDEYLEPEWDQNSLEIDAKFKLIRDEDG